MPSHSPIHLETSPLETSSVETSLLETSPVSAGPAPRWLLQRVGAIAQVGRFRLDAVGGLSRGTRTVTRTGRGLEVGQVLGPASESTTVASATDGTILRVMTAEDELLWGHLQQLAEEAHQACSQWLRSEGSAAVLLEVEPLLDGRTLYFHFLSEVEPPVQQHLDHLVSLYERQVQRSKFARLVEHGCGPGCGTAQAKNGCGSRGGCAVCKVAKACSSR